MQDVMLYNFVRKFNNSSFIPRNTNIEGAKINPEKSSP